MPTTGTLPQDPGPYSALFDYNKEAALEEAKNLQLQENQKKIMRTNAIGDAFRLLIDGIGGSKGATITPKAVNPGIMGASNKLYALDKENDSNLQRLRLTDMANKTRDIAYNQQLAETARANQLKLEEESRKYAHEDNLKNWERGNQLIDQKTKRGQEVADLGTRFDNSLKLQDNQAKNTRETNAEYLATLMGQYKPGRDRSKATSKEDVNFVIPGTKESIWISPAEILEMQRVVIGNKSKYDQTLEPVLRDLLKGDPTQKQSALLTLAQHWDEVKGVLGYPDSTAPASTTPNTPLLPGNSAAAPTTKYVGPVPAQSVQNTQPAEEDNGGLSADETAKLQTIQSNLNLTPDQKRTATYKLLIQQGYDPTGAKQFAEGLYPVQN